MYMHVIEKNPAMVYISEGFDYIFSLKLKCMVGRIHIQVIILCIVHGMKDLDLQFLDVLKLGRWTETLIGKSEVVFNETDRKYCH